MIPFHLLGIIIAQKSFFVNIGELRYNMEMINDQKQLLAIRN